MSDYNRYIVRSTEESEKIPEENLATYLLRCLRKRLPNIASHIWMADLIKGTSVRFADVDDQSRKVASILYKRGFRRGYVLYYSTYEMAQLYVVQLAVWRLGGTIRGCNQNETPAEYARQMRESYVKFILVDAETAPKLRQAVCMLQWLVKMISVGTTRVEGALNYADMMQDDGQSCPDKVRVHPRYDAAWVTNVMGRKGCPPRGVVHTHYTSVAMQTISRKYLPGGSMLTQSPNYTLEDFIFTLHSLSSGVTIYHMSKFKKEKYFDVLVKYKPCSISINPFWASWVAKSRELDDINLSFISEILVSGWVLDQSVAQLLAKRIPTAKINQIYGTPECLLVTSTAVNANSSVAQFALGENHGEKMLSLGKLLPNLKAKVVDINTGQTMGRGEKGEILLQSPCVMKGYLVPGKEPLNPDVDFDGWYRTGDMGFFDIFGNIYIIERLMFMFKHVAMDPRSMLSLMTWVSTVDVELALQQHPAVLDAGVVGVSHPDTCSVARAYVVLRPGRHVFSWEIQRYVASRLPASHHLHGGVRFLKSLPLTFKGLLNRDELQKMALSDAKRKNLVISDE